jgi:AcrR family transcriptional regulator
MTTVDEKLREATVAVLAEHGWTGVTLERVAEKAGRSRVTLWRQGLTREVLLNALLDDLAGDYRDSMWPALTAAGTGRERLVRAIEAFCDVVDRHLPLVLASDTIFHHEAERGGSVVYIEPFERFLREGAADGSLHPHGRIDDVAEILMVSVGFSYAHMRGRHHWSRTRTRRVILDLTLRGIIDP